MYLGSPTEPTEEKKADQPAGYFESLIIKIINNIQIFIDNVHVRFEDSVSNLESPFASGLLFILL
jgi:vacuolar protein sorting-associated protein 13A/C